MKKNLLDVDVQLPKKILQNKMADTLPSHDIVFIKDTEKVFISLSQSGIPPDFVDEHDGLDVVNFGKVDFKSNPIMYLDVDQIISFYDLEFNRMSETDEFPEEIKMQVLSNFFLFRRVKKDVIIKETIGITVWE